MWYSINEERSSLQRLQNYSLITPLYIFDIYFLRGGGSYEPKLIWLAIVLSYLMSSTPYSKIVGIRSKHILRYRDVYCPKCNLYTTWIINTIAAIYSCQTCGKNIDIKEMEEIYGR